MKIKLVVVDFELSARAKRIAAAMAIPMLVLGGGAIAYANVPHTWQDGDTLTANDLNANFSTLDARLAKLETGAPVAVLGVTTTKVVASGLGTTMDGSTGGYAGGKQQCMAAFPQSPNAHMCVASELVQFMANGGVMPMTVGAWYATGFRWDGEYTAGMPTDPRVGNDCTGFSGQGGVAVAPVFSKNPMASFGWDACDQSYAVLCCS